MYSDQELIIGQIRNDVAVPLQLSGRPNTAIFNVISYLQTKNWKSLYPPPPPPYRKLYKNPHQYYLYLSLKMSHQHGNFGGEGIEPVNFRQVIKAVIALNHFLLFTDK